MPLIEHPPQGLREARLADARLARDQHHLALAPFGLAPAVEQPLEFRLAADERGQAGYPPGFEAARRCALAEHLPHPNPGRETLQPALAEVAALEQAAEQAACTRSDDDAVWPCFSLEAGGEIGRFTDHRLFLRRPCADLLAHDDQAGGDSDTYLQGEFVSRPQLSDRRDQTQPRPHSAFCVVLVRLGIAEVGEHAVTQILGYVAGEATNHFGAAPLVSPHDLAQILWVQSPGELGGADKIAEQDCQLPALGLCACGRRCTASLGAECSDGLQELLAWAERQSKLFEVSLAELGEHFPVNLVVTERRLIAVEPEVPQPGHDVHVHLRTWP